jgi:GDP-L-fucose synthase
MKIFIAGHKGMVGSAILKKLSNKTDIETHTIEKNALDLLDQTRVFEYFYIHNFDLVIDCAAKVGGIHSNNTYRADFIYQNLQIQNNLIHASYLSNVKKFLFLGSSCI